MCVLPLFSQWPLQGNLENFHVNRLVKYSPPRLQVPSVLYKGKWGGWWRQPDGPGYPTIFQSCRTLVLGMPQDLLVLDDEILPCLTTAVQKSKCAIRVHQTRAPSFRHEPTLPDSLALCCTSSLSEARWTFSFLWKTDKLEHRRMPTWMYYYTSAHSHGPSVGKGFGTALPIVGLIDPGQLQHLCLGSSFHWESFGCFHGDSLDAFSLPCLKWGHVSAHPPPKAEKGLCSVLGDNCVQRAHK